MCALLISTRARYSAASPYPLRAVCIIRVYTRTREVAVFRLLSSETFHLRAVRAGCAVWVYNFLPMSRAKRERDFFFFCSGEWAGGWVSWICAIVEVEVEDGIEISFYYFIEN